jgi:5-methylcytosine-specific restriction protein B
MIQNQDDSISSIYAYEDFIQGIRPSEKSFKVKNGIFYDFCKKAELEPDQKYFLL